MFFLHPDYTGFGYGKKAVEYVLSLMSKIPKIEKQVITTSQYAYVFFQKYGYKLIKLKKIIGQKCLIYILWRLSNNKKRIK